ncbi:hypothetical protein FBEOM_9300 [Fusarium beomiforme]|uniref:Uncharacterized protein n=1 Tax=Fusarium beomiforme TaxID=44412 RepID=A0A9P5AE04_9HYPO|nr:hypothetical protein FBEOM_9300 [Fusarium beomiforme]
MAPTHKTPYVLILIEMAVSTTAVILFSLMYPVDFRSRLWENGGEQGWNSNPNKRIYYYANHQEPPEVPLIWSQRLYTSNLAIAILGLVVFFARTALSHLRYLPRYINNIYDAILLLLWAMSIASQMSSDFSDPEHPSPHPWYLARGCSAAWDKTRGARLISEALLIAYERGQRHPPKWPALDVEEVESIAGIYMDDDRESEAGINIKESRHSMALSPVLAFFPSSDNRW